MFNRLRYSPTRSLLELLHVAMQNRLYHTHLWAQALPLA